MDALSTVRERLQARNPGTRIDSVAASPIAGLYEVVMGRNVAYMDASGRYALFGNVWDMQERRDLTADRKAALDRVDVAALPKARALRHTRGQGSRVLYVFADPQCGYCRQLQQTLAGLDDLTVYTFVIPLLGPESRRLASDISCAADPAAAWAAWMLRGQAPQPAAAECAAGHGDTAEALAKSLGITGTPTLVAADGRKKAGSLPASQLAAWLAEPQLEAQRSRGGAGISASSTVKTAPR
ncbi:DsbC family protein [Rubrivivax sp. A210]|uniref:DsbC family protein n=1 Tax=Rubrivivax sp. A210 TaxID=2772301 RepID=UPI001917DB21|nr:DsbC family protein [Rubrivivax sp. A210]